MEVAEHILLESDLREVPDLRAARKVHARISFSSRLRRRSIQLEIIDYYYLAVRSQSRHGPLDYVLDLRFVEIPRLSRHIAWRWLAASLLLMSLGYGIVHFGPSALPWWQRHGVTAYAALAAAWLLTTLVALYRTTVTVRLLSSDGAAPFLEYTGGLGTLRGVRRFMAKVAAHVQLAVSARRSTKAQHLRDAMREHARLKELGVLSGPEYESSKARILGRHASPATLPQRSPSRQPHRADVERKPRR